MGIPVIATYEVFDGGASTWTVPEFTKPSGVTSGDLLVIIIMNDDGTATAQWNDSTYKPSGFTLIAAVGNSTSDAHVAAFYRVADGSEDATVVVNTQSADNVVGWYLRLTGVDTTAPINAVGTGRIVGGTATSVFDIPGLTTTANDCLVFAVTSHDGSDMWPVVTSGTGWSLWDDKQNLDSAVGSYAAGSVSTKELASFGSSLDCTITTQNAVNKDGAAMFQFAIKGAASAGGGVKIMGATVSKVDGATVTKVDGA